LDEGFEEEIFLFLTAEVAKAAETFGQDDRIF